MSNTIVTVTVDTQNITPSTINENVVFTDNHGATQPTDDPENFLSVVDPGTEIEWRGVPLIGTSEITMKVINKVTGPDIMEPGTMTFPGRDAKCDIASSYIHGIEKYYLKFEVGGVEYPVDPKLRMRRRQQSVLSIKARQFVNLFKIIGEILFKWTI